MQTRSVGCETRIALFPLRVADVSRLRCTDNQCELVAKDQIGTVEAGVGPEVAGNIRAAMNHVAETRVGAGIGRRRKQAESHHHQAEEAAQPTGNSHERSVRRPTRTSACATHEASWSPWAARLSIAFAAETSAVLWTRGACLATRRKPDPALRSTALACLSCGLAANSFIALPAATTDPDPVSA